MFKELIEKAKKLGITRAMLGEEMYGRSQYNRIYMIHNPTIATLDKLEKAKKMGYKEEPILENGIVWLTKKRLSFDLCFNNDGMVLLDGDDEYILAKDRTPDQMHSIMKALQ